MSFPIGLLFTGAKMIINGSRKKPTVQTKESTPAEPIDPKGPGSPTQPGEPAAGGGYMAMG
ncbi:hypothetical protein IJ818_03360 [bacterium]|nr:hypothetical protein [bacterium]